LFIDRKYVSTFCNLIPCFLLYISSFSFQYVIQILLEAPLSGNYNFLSSVRLL
jgi:hypothetical protein